MLVEVLELPLEGDAPQAVGDVQHLPQSDAEQSETPQERVGGAGVRPSPQRGAEEAQCEEGEQVEESVEAAATHEAEEEEDVGQVEDGALRSFPPLLTQWVHRRHLLHRVVHGFEVRGFHVCDQSDPNTNTEVTVNPFSGRRHALFCIQTFA